MLTTCSRGLPRTTSAIITIVVGADQRLFAAHEDVLNRSPYFRQACRDLFFSNTGIKQIDLMAEDPEVFSCVVRPSSLLKTRPWRSHN